MRDDLRRMALFGSGVAELTRNRAEQIARDLVERSKQNRSELLRVIRDEIRNQLAALGLAKERDVERLERRIARLEADVRAAPARTAKKTTGRKSTTKKTTAKKKPTARKPTTGGSTVSPS